MPACRIIVPGMSEIYPVDDLVWNNKNSGRAIRSQLLLLPDLSPGQLSDLLETLEEMNLNDQHRISDLTGVLFDPDSAWYLLSIGELKALLFLALKRYEPAHLWCEWCWEHSNLEPHRRRLFRLLTVLLGFTVKGARIADYRKALGFYFSKEELSKAEKIISAELTFPGLTFAGSWQTLSSSHANILKLYKQINRIKKQPV